MAILDTSVLLPIIDAGHVHHAKAREAVRPHPLWHVTPGVIAELTQLVRKAANARGGDGNIHARHMLENLGSTTAFRPLGQYDHGFVERIYQTNAGLSFVDAWSIAVAVDRVEPLVTLDDRQRKVWERLR